MVEGIQEGKIQSNPEVVRGDILRALSEYEIKPLDTLDVQNVRYGFDYFEFSFQEFCGDLLPILRIVGDEVYTDVDGDLKLIEHSQDSDWIIAIGIVGALFLDPRWLVRHLRDLNLDTVDNQTVLSGNIYASDCNLSTDRAFNELEKMTKKEIIQAASEDNLYSQEELRVFRKMDALDLRKKIKEDILTPWNFQMFLDENNLPVRIKAATAFPEGFFLDNVLHNGIGFSYTLK